MVSSILTRLCKHRHYLTPEYFNHPQKKPNQQSSLHYVLLPQTLVTTNIPSVLMDFLILNILYKWNHTKCGLLCPASFTYHNLFKVYLYWNIYQYFIPVYCRIVNIPLFRCTVFFKNPFINGWTCGLFPLFFFFFTILNNTAIEHLCTVLHGHLFSNLLSVYLEVEFLGHAVTLCVNFWGTARLFCKVSTPFCISASSVWGFLFLHILTVVIIHF